MNYEKALCAVNDFIDIKSKELGGSAEAFEQGQLQALGTVKFFVCSLHDKVVRDDEFDISLCQVCKRQKQCQKYCRGWGVEPRFFKMFLHNIKFSILNKWRENHGQNR